MSGPGEIQAASLLGQVKAATPQKAAAPQSAGIDERFEKMLWAEMLKYAGLEKAFTQSGGEAASAFSRYIVEAIAEDLAEKHPLGLNPTRGASEAYTQLNGGETES